MGKNKNLIPTETQALNNYDHNSDYTLYAGMNQELRKQLLKLIPIPIINLTSSR